MLLYGALSEPGIQSELTRAQAEPGEWTVYLVKARGAKRTAAQNVLFRRIVRRIAQQQGRSVQYWQDYLVSRFLGYDEVVTEDGFTRKVLCSTSELSVPEFSHFLNACLAFAADHQIDLS